tara:strand:- start:20 stop:1117 length:1098 start_codon:yes stop_codon:yes gene_type:complete
MEGPQATLAVINQLAGFEAGAEAWESEILPARVRDYRGEYLDSLHTAGQAVWLRLKHKRAGTGRAGGPLKSTPIAIVPRGDLLDWLSMVALPGPETETTLSATARHILGVLETRGAAFFDDLVERCGVLKSQCEQALGELAAAGCITADSFAALRVLLTPPSRRRPLHGARRRGVSVVGLDTAGRWDIVPRMRANAAVANDSDSDEIDCVVRTLLDRYGVVFKRVVERETALPPWRYLLWALRRLEARGEVRGGRFVAGYSGEQFALPEALEALRKIRKAEPQPDVIVVNATDPLNLVGILTPGLRIPANSANRIAFVGGEAVAVRLGEEIRLLQTCASDVECRVRTALIGRHGPQHARNRLRRR